MPVSDGVIQMDICVCKCECKRAMSVEHIECRAMDNNIVDVYIVISHIYGRIHMHTEQDFIAYSKLRQPRKRNMIWLVRTQ